MNIEQVIGRFNLFGETDFTIIQQCWSGPLIGDIQYYSTNCRARSGNFLIL